MTDHVSDLFDSQWMLVISWRQTMLDILRGSYSHVVLGYRLLRTFTA